MTAFVEIYPQTRKRGFEQLLDAYEAAVGDRIATNERTDIQMTANQVQGPAIHVQGLEKSYKQLEVLRGVDFDVARGSIFALLGSNGAGKTTVVKILSTLLKTDAGTASVNGFDVATQACERAGVHQPHRTVRGRRRDPQRAGEPRAGRPACDTSRTRARSRMTCSIVSR